MDNFSVKIPFNVDNPLELKDLRNYFDNLEKYFQSQGVELEIYEAQVGSFIPSFRQVSQGLNALLTISSIFSNFSPILQKINDNQPLSAQEIKTIQPIIIIGRNNTVVQNVTYNNNSFDTSKFDTSKLEQTNSEIEQQIESESKIYESQELIFTKIDTKDNNQCAGKITELNDKIKKISFATQDIKNEFYFSDTAEPFKHTYTVDVKVYYNKNGSIARYEIFNLIDIQQDTNNQNEKQ
jgi:hypothetical protein